MRGPAKNNRSRHLGIGPQADEAVRAIAGLSPKSHLRQGAAGDWLHGPARSREKDAAFGCSLGPLHTHILIREWKPRTEPERLEVLVHELGHFLGACHSPENDSVMRPLLGDGRANLRLPHWLRSNQRAGDEPRRRGDGPSARARPGGTEPAHTPTSARFVLGSGANDAGRPRSSRRHPPSRRDAARIVIRAAAVARVGGPSGATDGPGVCRYIY